MTTRTVLITGGMGFIGAHTTRAFLDTGWRVVATRYSRPDIPDFLGADVGNALRVEPLDVGDRDALARIVAEHGVDSVVHLAVPPIGAAAFRDEFDANLGGLANLLDLAKREGLRRVTLASSTAVYHSIPGGPYHEDARLPMHSRMPTEAFKKCEEVLALHFAERTGVDLACVRIASVYGPLYRTLINVPSRIVHAAARGVAAPLPHATAPAPLADDASDFCYVKDIARGLFLLHSAQKLSHRVYNLGAGRATSSSEILAAVRAAQPSLAGELAPGRRTPADHWMDIGRAAEEVGYRPEYDIDRAVRDYLAWLQSGHAR